MHLKTIKLLGFKSFVDTQLLELPSRITAIVGPNGCGKSNVIDAVKWVIGESHAKQLRGDLMTDVIFNGSSQRKPVGQAHVELTFDNSSQILKGPFSHYNEVTVKRVIGRDATSVYAINQTRCRRKDVIDLFTGTGLGPRSYAIIEQGMINRFIEAKPADLRGYLEEAAVISRYYEKRKETLSHLEETTENLNRIKDLEDEIQKRCKVLEQQAAEAAQYQQLRQECVTLKQQYLSSLYRTALQEQEAITLKIQENTLSLAELEKIYLQSQKQIYDLERSRDHNQQVYNDSKDDLHQKIQLRQQSQHQLDQIVLQIQFQESKQKEAQEQALRLQTQIDTLEQWLLSQGEQTQGDSPQALELDRQLAEIGDAVKNSEKQVLQEEQSLKSLISQNHEEKRKQDSTILQLRNNQQHSLNKRESLKGLEKDKETLARKYEESDSMPYEVAMASLQTDSEELQHQLKDWKSQQTTLLTQIQSDQTTKALLDQEFKGATKRKLDLDAQIAAHQKTRSSWLNPSQQAFPVTLTTWENLEGASDYMSSVPTQFVYQGQTPVTLAQLSVQADLDLEYVWGGQQPAYWANYIPIDSAERALAQLDSLRAEQAYLLPGGILLGKNWVRPWRQRAPIFTQLLQERSDLDARIAVLTADLQSLSQRLQQNQTQKQNLDQKILHSSRQFDSLQQQIQKHLLDIARLKQARQDLAERQKFNAAQIEQTHQVLQRLGIEEADLEILRKACEQAVLQFSEKTFSIENSLKSAKMAYQDQIKAKDRVIAQKHEYIRAQDLHRAQYAQNQKQSADAKKNLEDLAALIEKYGNDGLVHQESLEAQKAHIALQDPFIDALQLEMQRLQETLQAANAALIRDLKTLKQQEKSFSQCQDSLQNLKTQLEKILFHQTYLTDQILDQGWLVDQIILVLSEIPVLDMKKRIATLEEQLRDLGAVNLKALQEYDQQRERHKEYITQRTDLEAAMQELNQAVALLDADMKNLFDTTFTQLKGHFETLFPVLFAGGFGSLTLETDPNTGENGIIIHAQPPGKKNTRLSILSGGEKALTAAALVFSFFQLNPAPFCLLDEIDAPLDDANTQRLGAMIASLKDRIQFIVVTHSKVMMEYADSLYGVTMKEPGVSKFVSVNLVEALETIDS